jgi:hypothetical protein
MASHLRSPTKSGGRDTRNEGSRYERRMEFGDEGTRSLLNKGTNLNTIHPRRVRP